MRYLWDTLYFTPVGCFCPRTNWDNAVFFCNETPGSKWIYSTEDNLQQCFRPYSLCFVFVPCMSCTLRTDISHNLKAYMGQYFECHCSFAYNSILPTAKRNSTTAWCKAVLTQRLLNTWVSGMADKIHIYWLWLYFIQRRHQLYRSCKKGRSVLYKTKDLNYPHGLIRRIKIKCKLESTQKF